MLKITVGCTLEGLENVEVTYNLMASESELEQFSEQMGRNGTHEPIVKNVENWPEEYGEPFGKQTPFAFYVWISRKGFAHAVKRYLDDPSL